MDWLEPETDDYYLIINQSGEGHIPCSPAPKFCLKNFSLKLTGECRTFEVESLVLFAWPCNKAFSAPNSELSVCLTSKISLHNCTHKVTNVIKLMGILSCQYFHNVKIDLCYPYPAFLNAYLNAILLMVPLNVPVYQNTVARIFVKNIPPEVFYCCALLQKRRYQFIGL